MKRDDRRESDVQGGRAGGIEGDLQPLASESSQALARFRAAIWILTGALLDTVLAPI